MTDNPLLFYLDFCYYVKLEVGTEYVIRFINVKLYGN